MDAETQKAHLAEVKVPSAIPKIITTGYHSLQLIHFFTAGPKEVRCWTVRVCHCVSRCLIHGVQSSHVCLRVCLGCSLVVGVVERNTRSRCCWRDPHRFPRWLRVCRGDGVHRLCHTQERNRRQGCRPLQATRKEVRCARWRHHLLQGQRWCGSEEEEVSTCARCSLVVLW
jgi:hypothetical protein